MYTRVSLTAGVPAASLLLLAVVAPLVPTLMSAEPTAGQPEAKIVSAIPGDSSGIPVGSAEAAILKALAEHVEWNLVEDPLSEVIEYVSDHHRIEVMLDGRALADLGVGGDEPITCRLAGVSLRSALELVLRDLDLTWTIDSEVLLVTTHEEAECRLTTKTYNVGDLVVCRDEDGRLWDDYETLIDVITGTVEPVSWEETTGGPGAIDGRTFASAKVLVIRQSCRVHVEVAQLLDSIRKVAEKHGTNSEPPVRERPNPKSKEASESVNRRLGDGMFMIGTELPWRTDPVSADGEVTERADQ